MTTCKARHSFYFHIEPFIYQGKYISMSIHLMNRFFISKKTIIYFKLPIYFIILLDYYKLVDKVSLELRHVPKRKSNDHRIKNNYVQQRLATSGAAGFMTV
jgi:hypothetical protein